jgi:hypothetical protein
VKVGEQVDRMVAEYLVLHPRHTVRRALMVAIRFLGETEAAKEPRGRVLVREMKRRLTRMRGKKSP